MRVQKVQVKNFLSVKDSDEIRLDRRITVLIGINESGKTNFLRALESLNPAYEYKEENLCYYSGVKEKFEREEIKPKDIEMIRVWFEIEEEDREKLGAIHEELAKIKSLNVTKYFSNEYKVGSPGYKIAKLKPDIKKIEETIKKIEAQTNDLVAKFAQHTERHPPFASDKPQYEQIFSNFLSTDFHDLSKVEPAFQMFYDNLLELPNIDELIESDIGKSGEVLENLENELLSLLQMKDITQEILGLIPNLIYFNQIDMLKDSTKIDLSIRL